MTLKEAEAWAKKHKANDGTNVEYIDEDQYDRDNKVEAAGRVIDNILCKTDWLFVSDVKIEQKHRKIYIEYRAYLRKSRKQFHDGMSKIWIEDFNNYARRSYPELFMEGANGPKMVKKFNHYL